MQFIKRNAGFTLVELVIVIAISLMLIGIVSGVYVLRRQTAYDDAAQQVASSLQTIRNEAQQGSGVSVVGANGNLSGILPGDKIYGQTIKFRFDCGGGVSCMEVNKLLSRDSGGTINLIPYDRYQVSVPEGLKFINNNTSFSTSYTPTNDSSNNGSLAPPTGTFTCPPTGGIGPRLLSCAPLSNGFPGAFIVAPNLQSGKMLLIKAPADPFPSSISESSLLTPPSSGSTPQSGVLYLALANNTDPANASAKYYIAIDLSSSGTIKVIKI